MKILKAKYMVGGWLACIFFNACQTVPFPPVSVPPSSALSESIISPATSPSPSAVLPFPQTSQSVSGTPFIAETSSLQGRIYSDTGQLLSDARVEARSLNSSTPYSIETVSQNGIYNFDSVPVGVQIELKASKFGFTTRQQVVLLAKQSSVASSSAFDFGTAVLAEAEKALTALSDKPEIIAVTPASEAQGVSQQTTFILKFSEPVDKASVEDHFVIRTFLTRQLSVDFQTSLIGSHALNSITGTQIFDKQAFQSPSWGADNTEVAFTLKQDVLLPSDRQRENLPVYQISLSANEQHNSLKDLQGNSRQSKHFKLTHSQPSSSTFFTVQPDFSPPQALQMALVKGAKGEKIEIEFNEPMKIQTDKLIMGGIDGNKTKAVAALRTEKISVSERDAAENYQLFLQRGGEFILRDINWNQVGGSVIFSSESTKKVWLEFPPLPENVSNLAFLPLYTEAISDAGQFFSDNIDNQTITFRLVKSDGAFLLLPFSLANNLSDLKAIAFDLEAKLNHMALKLDPQFEIPPFKLNDESQHLKIKFQPKLRSGTTYCYLGVLLPSHLGGEAKEPLPALQNLSNLQAAGINRRANFLQNGDQLFVRLASTILDPAGNPLQSDKNMLQTMIAK